MNHRRVRVLFVIESLGRAGAEQALVSLIPALKEEGVDSEVAVLWPPEKLADQLESEGTRVHRLRLRHRWSAPEALWKLGRLQRGFDLVHAHLFFADLYVGLARALAPRQPRLVTFHNLAYQARPATTLFHRARKAVDRAAHLHLFDGLYAVSASVAQHFGEEFGPLEIGVVPNPVQVESFSKGSRGRFGWSDEDFVLCFPGRFVAEKAHSDLVTATQLLHARGHPVRLLLIGDGPLLPSLRQQVAGAGLEGSVVFTGSLPHSEVLGLLASADVFVSSSTSEAFGLAAAEAMALGLPVVVTDVGGHPELVRDGKTGLLVPARSPDSLADAIERLHQDPALRRLLGEAARVHVSDDLAPRAVARRWAAIYRSALRDPSR